MKLLRNSKGQFRASKFIAWSIVLSMALVFMIAGIKAFAQSTGSVISYQTVEKIVTVDSPATVMDRISHCESGGSQFGKNGQVLVKMNTSPTYKGTADIGKYQINLSIWGSKATALGFNLFTEKGNTDMAYWIYKNKGTGDWYLTASCWSK